jgi:membrane fusion protein (multidrug efflux system)
VDFTLPQQNLAQLKTGLGVRVSTDSYPGKKFEGELVAINPDLDSVTRNITLRARFDNTNEMLRAGMFVRVEVQLPESEPSLVIPATALLSAPYGDSVFVVTTAAQAGVTNMPGTNLVVTQTFIRTGRSHGDFVTVENGLKPGDTVATAGIFKLRSGIAVVEDNDIVPKASENPMVPNK